MKAPRCWTSVELLLRDEDDDDEEPREYRSIFGGRTEPRPNGHADTLASEWRDGERIAGER